jgi:hypothetical protein
MTAALHDLSVERQIRRPARPSARDAVTALVGRVDALSSEYADALLVPRDVIDVIVDDVTSTVDYLLTPRRSAR